MHRVLLLLPLAACIDTVPPDPGTPAPTCNATIVEVLGTDGSSPVSPTADLLVRFSEPVDEDWRLELVDVAADATLGADRRAAVIAPEAPLDADEAYTLRASLCGRTTSRVVTTGPHTKPDREADAAAFLLPLDEVVWLQPGGLDEWLSGPDRRDLTMAIGQADGRPTVELGLVHFAEWGQSRCGDFVPLTVERSDLRGVEAGADDVELGRGHHRLSFESVDVTGSRDMHEDLVDVHLAGSIDTRSLGERGDAICRALAYGEHACQPCADGAATCLDVVGIMHRPERLDADPRQAEDACP